MRTERAPFVAIALLALMQCISLWAARFPVMQDIPAHTEMSCQLLQIWRGDERFTSLLLVHPQPWANSLPTVMLALLLAIVPSLAMMKLLLSVALLAWPLSLAVLFRRVGATPWLAILCVPFSFDLAWSYGFFQFICAKPLLALCLLLAHRVITQRETSPLQHALQGSALVVLLVFTFVTHSLVFLIALAGCAVVVVVCASSPRTWWRAWPLAFAALVTAPFFVATRVASSQPTQWRDGALASFWDDLGDQRAGALDAVPFMLVVVAIAVLAVAHARRQRGPAESFARGRAALALIGALVFLAWLKGPVVLPQVSVVSPRLLSLAVVLAIGALPNVSGRALRVVVATLVCAVLVQTAATTAAYRAFSRDEMGDFDALLAKIPPHARIATHYASPFSPTGNHNALWHWPKLACLTGASFTDDLFAYRKTAYVELRGERRAFQLPPHRLNPAALSDYDALLVRGDVRALSLPSLQAELTLLGESGTWHLYAIRK